MGCCGSSEAEPIEAEDVEITEVESGVTEVAFTKISLNIAEVESLKAKPNTETFIGSVLKAQEICATVPEVLLECCTRLQAYNERIKEYIAIYDSATVDEAMNGGFMGLGCNDNKLIAAMCTRTKRQIQRTVKAYRNKCVRASSRSRHALAPRAHATRSRRALAPRTCARSPGDPSTARGSLPC